MLPDEHKDLYGKREPCQDDKTEEIIKLANRNKTVKRYISCQEKFPDNESWQDMLENLVIDLVGDIELLNNRIKKAKEFGEASEDPFYKMMQQLNG